MAEKQRNVEITLELVGDCTVAETIRFFRIFSEYGIPRKDGAHGEMRCQQVSGKAVQPPRPTKPRPAARKARK